MVDDVYQIVYSKYANKDIKLLKQAHLDNKAKNLIEIIRINPIQTLPPYEKLVVDLKGAFSMRINRQHRLIYKFDEEKKVILMIRMWTHYE